jgi:hypothetical protein
LRFEKVQHLRQVQAWATAHGYGTINEKTLSSIGFIVPGVAAAWLYPTPSGVAYADNLITNPNASMKERHRAVKSLVEQGKVLAKQLGFCYLIFYSSIAPTFFRSIGAKSLKPFCHVLEL